MTVVAERLDAALSVLAVEEVDAWREYLAATRDQAPARYEEMEPWAWSRLGSRLRAIQARRRAVEERDS